jgi:hypothetical protein
MMSEKHHSVNTGMSGLNNVRVKVVSFYTRTLYILDILDIVI